MVSQVRAPDPLALLFMSISPCSRAMGDPQQLPCRRPPCAMRRASHDRRLRCSGRAGCSEPLSGQNAIVDNEQLCPSSVTNASAKSSRSDIPVSAGRSMPKKVLNPLEKFPLSKCKRALLMAPTEARKRDHSGRKIARADRKNLFSSGDYGISRPHSALLRDRQPCRTTKRQWSRGMCESAALRWLVRFQLLRAKRANSCATR